MLVVRGLFRGFRNLFRTYLQGEPDQFGIFAHALPFAFSFEADRR
jgi:hypothetical protein